MSVAWRKRTFLCAVALTQIAGSLAQDPISNLSQDDAVARLCQMNISSLTGATVFSNTLVLSSICGVGNDTECRDVFPMTEFGIPLECSYIVENKLCQQQNILEGDYCANSCGRCAKCKTTLSGCQCKQNWIYQATGENFDGCANPDNDPNGPWCLVELDTCEGTPSGKGYDHCNPACDPSIQFKSSIVEQGDLASEDVVLNREGGISPSSETPVVTTVTNLDGAPITTPFEASGPEQVIPSDDIEPTVSPSPQPSPTISPQVENSPSPSPPPPPSPSPSPSPTLTGEDIELIRSQQQDPQQSPQAIIDTLGIQTTSPPNVSLVQGNISLLDTLSDALSEEQNEDRCQTFEQQCKEKCGGEYENFECETQTGTQSCSCLEAPNTLIETNADNLSVAERLMPVAAPQEGPSIQPSQEWIDSHNSFRSLHCADDLSWDQQLADKAQELADSCTIEEVSGLGRNIYRTSASSVTADQVVQYWYDSGLDFNFGDSNPASTSTGTMTQILWKNTRVLGCGIGSSCSDGWLLAYCLYDPAGNVNNQYATNVLPDNCREQNGGGIQVPLAPKDLTIVQRSTPEESTPVPAIVSTTPSPQLPTSSKAWEDAHNLYRQQHCVQDLNWDQQLGNMAKQFADSCTIADVGSYGRNIYQTTASSVTALQVVEFWYNNGEGYDFDNPRFDPQSGTMTQILWSRTTKVGCGIGQMCSDGFLYVYCIYNPAGNIPNQMASNVLKKCT
eukprot:TRINITY_DN6911_c0_g1_i2.p1 TRINITY_DN6911_c0_g1~~TRINITY_DN6911_c0_g1_i2.p1  ORF type:complete len:732 (-),score=66.34 TRINITY_DN6911_c0_g1_i2:350-2545(-)